MTAALTRVETWRLLRHPFVLVGLALSSWLLWREITANRPVLHFLDLATPTALMPLAGATLVAANLATLRARRDHTEDLYTTTPGRPVPRAAAHLAALFPVALVAVALVAAGMAWAATDPYAVGIPSLLELAAGPVVVLLAGTLGVALGRLVPVPVAGPLALVGWLLVTMVVFAVGPAVGPGLLWFSALVPDFRPDAPPSGAVLARPAGWHVVYLLALAAGLAALTVARVGARRSGLGGFAAALALVLAAGVLQAGTAPGSATGDARVAAAEAALRQTCQDRGPVTYCAYPGFEVRVPLWHDVVRRVRDRIPAAAASAPLRVTQQAQHWDAASSGAMGKLPPSGPADPVVVPVSWPAGDTAGFERLRLGISVAQRALALPALSTAGREGCRPAAGGGVALWLAAVADPGAAAALRADLQDLRDAGSGLLYVNSSHSSLSDFTWSRAEGEQAVLLLDRPEAEVRGLVADHWALLTAPGGTLAQAATALSLPAPAC
ncbi:hypothetical protein [Longispora urticae]